LATTSVRGDDFGSFGAFNLGTITGRVGSSPTSLKYPTSSAGRTEESPIEGRTAESPFELQIMLQSKLTAKRFTDAAMFL
jgi:hypothetical protein